MSSRHSYYPHLTEKELRLVEVNKVSESTQLMNGRGRIWNQAACLQSQCTYWVAPCVLLEGQGWETILAEGKEGLGREDSGDAVVGEFFNPSLGILGFRWGWELGAGRDCQGGSGISLGPGSCWVLCATTYPTLFWAPWRSLSIFFQEVHTSIQISVSWLSKKESLWGMEGGEIEWRWSKCASFPS